MRQSKLIYFFVFLIGTLIFCGGCETYQDDVIPYVEVDFMININTDAEFMVPLGTAPSSLKLTEHPQGKNTIGYNNNGVILFHHQQNIEFYVFDATCTNDVAKNVSLEVNGNLATCPVCGSTYLLSGEGIPTDGSESRYFLKKYRSTLHSDGTLHVYN